MCIRDSAESANSKETINIQLSHDAQIEAGKEIGFRFEAKNCYLFDENGARI